MKYLYKDSKKRLMRVWWSDLHFVVMSSETCLIKRSELTFLYWNDLWLMCMYMIAIVIKKHKKAVGRRATIQSQPLIPLLGRWKDRSSYDLWVLENIFDLRLYSIWLSLYWTSGMMSKSQSNAASVKDSRRTAFHP